MEAEPTVRPSRQIRKFKRFAEQEEADFRYWMKRTPTEKLAAITDMTRHAYSFRDPALGKKPFAHLPPVRDAQGQVIPPSRVVRRFASFEAQQEWNESNAWPKETSDQGDEQP